VRTALRATAALLTATLVALGSLAAPVAAATLAPSAETSSDAAAKPSSAKIVIIVGPTHGLTNSNRQDADEAYAEALRWTDNVYRYYSPNALWSTIKPQLTGANIVVYLGHGNGWPSPYTYDPKYTTKDGFGLNDPSNRSDNVVKYYGEPYIDDLALAPGAVVILNHACYSSGSSEPGQPEPSLSVAKQRVDNFGAAFIRAKASAVIAAYKGSAANYIHSLFTMSGTVFEAWRATPGYHDHEISFASTRSSGRTAILDPDTAGGGGYNRSIVGSPGALVSTVVGQLPTDTDPSSFVVPGAAEVGSGGADLHASADDGSDVVAHLDASTHLRLLAQEAWWGAEGSPDAWYQAEAPDGTTGWARGYDLIPRDSMAPGFFELAVNHGQMYFGQTWRLDATLSETAEARVRLNAPDGTTIASRTVTGNALALSWDGTIDGVAGPNGKYRWTVNAVDAWGNAMPQKSGALWFRDNSVPGTYITLPPTRLLDTGLGIGTAAGPLPPSSPRTFPVAGQGGVPADATAVTGVLRVVYPTKSGYVTISPLPDATPATATVHFVASQLVATGVTMGLAPDGSLAVVYKGAAGGSVRLVFEVTGYYR
jgi:hypothetical protein